MWVGLVWCYMNWMWTGNPIWKGIKEKTTWEACSDNLKHLKGEGKVKDSIFFWDGSRNIAIVLPHGIKETMLNQPRLSALLKFGGQRFAPCAIHLWCSTIGVVGCSCGMAADVDATETIELQVLCLTGEGVTLTVDKTMLGREVRQMVSTQLSGKAGSKIVLTHLDANLVLSQSLEGQGIVGKNATLCCTYVPTDLYFAWCFLQGLPTQEAEFALEGVTSLKHLRGGKCLVHLPKSLQSLTLDQTLSPFTVPSSLKNLMLGGKFNQSLEGVILPSSLQNLTFGNDFDQSLVGVILPSSLQNLTFGASFNQSLENVTLPSSLQNLTFGHDFDQSLVGVTLPSSLQNLTFGMSFSQSLEGVTMPNSLQNLTFESLVGVTLPSSLKNLTFGHKFDQSLEGVILPSSLQNLTFGDDFDQSLVGVILPSSLQNLTFGRSFSQSLENMTLPSSLQNLTFGMRFNQSLERVTLPNSLQNLTFGHSFNQSLDRVNLPSSLQNLTFGNLFNHSLEGVTLSSRLQGLTLGFCFDQSLEGVTLPSSLQNLTFGRSFNQSLEGVTLPSSLQKLSFGSSFSQSFESVSFPSTLESLTLRRECYGFRQVASLPNVRRLQVGETVISVLEWDTDAMEGYGELEKTNLLLVTQTWCFRAYLSRPNNLTTALDRLKEMVV